MKQTVQPNASKRGQDISGSTRFHASNPSRSNSYTGYTAQLATAINSSPQTLAQLKDGIQQSPRVQGLMGLAAEINQSVPAQLRGTAMDDNLSLEYEALDWAAPSRLSPLISVSAPVQRVLGYHVVTSAPEPEAESSDEEEPVREVRLREAPNGAFKQVFISVGQGVKVTEERDEWVQVESGGGTGWMLIEFLTRQPNPADEENTSWEQARGQPFGSDDSDPALEDVRQGELDNCFFLAPLAAIAHAPDGPTLIRNILQGAGLGEYRVGFYEVTEENEVNKEPDQVTVDKWFPSDMEGTFLYSPAGESLKDADFPTWSAIVEKAFAWWGSAEDDSDESHSSEEASGEDSVSAEEEEDNREGYAASELGVAAVALANLVGIIPRSLSWNAKSRKPRTLEGIRDTATLWHENAITEGEDEDKPDFKPTSVKNISSNALFKALHDLRGDRNNVLVVESNNAGHGHETFLNPHDPQDLQIREGHVYVITSVYKHTVRLWDPITQKRTARMPIGKFKTLFNRVLTANIGESPVMDQD